MAYMNDITAEYVQSILDYDPATGIFRWKSNVGRRIRCGDVAGCTHKQGYIHIKIRSKSYKAHRLAWLVTHGEWPMVYMDHIDCDKGNNAIVNLREANEHENSVNCPLRIDNASGFKGVSFSKRHKKFRAHIQNNGKRVALGYFDKPEDAYTAYCNSANELHGEFARVS